MSGSENITVSAPRLPTSGQQYLRTISLTVGQSAAAQDANLKAAVESTSEGNRAALYNYDTAPTTLDLSQLRVVFNIVAASASTARQLNARVFNVARSTASTIEQEFDTVSLSAGYQGTSTGLLFSGTIQQKRYGRESATDTFLDIFASDGYDLLANGFISQTLAEGWTPLGVYNQIILAGAPYGLKASSVLPPDDPKGIRPLVLFGTLRKVMDGLAKNLGLHWSIENNVLNFVLPSIADQQLAPPTTSLIVSDTSFATVLSTSTGLIGIPIQTLDGIEATCLLNSRIKPGGLIKIDSSLIIAAKNDLAVSAVNPYPSIAADGIYRVMWTEHEGDTRGQPWYTHIVAEALTGAGTIQSSAIEKAGFAGGL